MNRPQRDTDRRRAGKGPPMGDSRPLAPAGADLWKQELAEVYRAHGEFVRRCAGHVGVPEPQRDDVVHDVFLIVYRRLPQFDQARGSWRSWLFGITKRVAMHHRRSVARHERRLRVVPQPARRPEPDEAYARHQVAERIDAFLASLPEAKRIVFTLTDIEGMPAADVARSLGLNVNTVYARLRSARLRFSEVLDQLEEEGHDDG